MPKTIPAKYIFLDIEGFTHNRSGEAQSDIIQTLNGIVDSVIHKYGIPADHLLLLPAGDGICAALLNIESPYDIHLSIALDIIRGVYQHNTSAAIDEMRKFQLRIGLNSNIDNLITDINGNRNIAGEGFNLTARVMQLADGNQILVSEPVFEVLNRYGKYPSSFKAFRAKVKHGLEMPVYQFIGEGHEGLNRFPPSSLQEITQSDSGEQTFYPQAERRNPVQKRGGIDKTQDFTGSLPDTQYPSPVRRQESPAPAPQTNETQSYLKKILPEDEPAKPAAAAINEKKWIKAATGQKTEPLSFLQQSTEPKSRRSLSGLAALALLLAGGCAIFGIWFWTRAEQNSNLAGSNQPATPIDSSNQSSNSGASPATSSSNPALNSIAPAAGGEKGLSAASNDGEGVKSKSSGSATVKNRNMAETIRSNGNNARRAIARSESPLPQRSFVQRIVSQRAPQLSKRQPVKAAGLQRKVDIDDVIDGKKTDVLRRVNIDDIINQK